MEAAPVDPVSAADAGPRDAKDVEAGDVSDAVWVERARTGDRAAFDHLIVRHQRQAMAVAYRLLGNTQDSLEVTQDAFLKAYTSLASLQKADAFAGWLMRIVSNLALNYRRSRKVRQQMPLDDVLASSDAMAESAGTSDAVAVGNDPARAVESRELGVRLQEAIKLLPEKQRLAIVMFTVEEMPQKQVAETLNCSVEAVKWHVFQGRKKLKELLKGYI